MSTYSQYKTSDANLGMFNQNNQSDPTLANHEGLTGRQQRKINSTIAQKQYIVDPLQQGLGQAEGGFANTQQSFDPTIQQGQAAFGQQSDSNRVSLP